MSIKQIRLRALSVFIGLAVIFQYVGHGAAANHVVDLAMNEQDVVIRGSQPNSYFGEVGTHGDFNGDGYDDLLIGAAGFAASGRENSGAAFVILGNPAASVNLATTPAALTLYGASVGDILGHSVAAGDVNGDGIADIIVGADLNGVADRGAVYVYLGRNDGFFNTPQVLDMASANTAIKITGNYSNGRLGRSVATGDINGDGIDDIIIGAYTASPGGRVEAGAVYAILGRNDFSNSNPVTIDLSSQNAALTILGGEGTTVASNRISEVMKEVHPLFADEVYAVNAGIGGRLGRSVAVADVNGDGIDDIIAGAYGADANGKVDSGKTYVFYGSSSYSSGSTVIDLGSNPGLANVTLNGVDAGDQSGFFVGSGDLNHNGYSDILISAYRSQGYSNTGNETGEVYVVYGKPNLPAAINLASGADVTVFGAASGDRLGRSLATGDINGDGYDDLLLGASRADPQGRNDAGAAYVIFGRSKINGTIRLNQELSAEILIYGAKGGATCTADPGNGQVDDDCGDEAGRAISAADVNNDGYDDIIVGALFANNGDRINAGAAYVIYGEAREVVDPGPDPFEGLIHYLPFVHK